MKKVKQDEGMDEEGEERHLSTVVKVSYQEGDNCTETSTLDPFIHMKS